jgi:hypothetical protein
MSYRLHLGLSRALGESRNHTNNEKGASQNQTDSVSQIIRKVISRVIPLSSKLPQTQPNVLGYGLTKAKGTTSSSEKEVAVQNVQHNKSESNLSSNNSNSSEFVGAWEVQKVCNNPLNPNLNLKEAAQPVRDEISTFGKSSSIDENASVINQNEEEERGALLGETKPGFWSRVMSMISGATHSSQESIEADRAFLREAEEKIDTAKPVNDNDFLIGTKKTNSLFIRFKSAFLNKFFPGRDKHTDLDNGLKYVSINGEPDAISVSDGSSTSEEPSINLSLFERQIKSIKEPSNSLCELICNKFKKLIGIRAARSTLCADHAFINAEELNDSAPAVLEYNARVKADSEVKARVILDSFPVDTKGRDNEAAKGEGSEKVELANPKTTQNLSVQNAVVNRENMVTRKIMSENKLHEKPTTANRLDAVAARRIADILRKDQESEAVRAKDLSERKKYEDQADQFIAEVELKRTLRSLPCYDMRHSTYSK